VVAFTSAGRGMDNDLKPFFSQELGASKAPDDVRVMPLPLSLFATPSVNVTWTPLTLFEARGFPEYVVTLDLPNLRKRQSPVSVTTSDSFAVFENLMAGAMYSTVVGVMTGNDTAPPMRAPAVTGNLHTT